MRPFACAASLAATVVLAAEPFLNEPDTGLVDYLAGTNYTAGTLPPLKDMRAVLDFDWAARQFLDNQKYSFYRTAAGGEWSESSVSASQGRGEVGGDVRREKEG